MSSGVRNILSKEDKPFPGNRCDWHVGDDAGREAGVQVMMVCVCL